MGPECANTDVSRGLAESGIGWRLADLLGFAGMLGAILVQGKRGACLTAAAAAVALVSSTATLADLSAPFEAIRPRPGLAPLGVLCELEPATGYWLAAIAWLLAGIVAWRRVDPRAGWASRRLAGAIAVGALNVMLSWIWVLVLVDVVVDTTSDRPSDAGVIAVGFALAAMAAVAAWLAWPAIGGRAMVARGLLARRLRARRTAPAAGVAPGPCRAQRRRGPRELGRRLLDPRSHPHPRGRSVGRDPARRRHPDRAAADVMTLEMSGPTNGGRGGTTARSWHHGSSCGTACCGGQPEHAGMASFPAIPDCLASAFRDLRTWRTPCSVVHKDARRMRTGGPK